MSPEARVRFGWGLLAYSLAGWVGSHVLILVTHPPESSWVFHMLLAISWQAISITAWDVITTSNVHKKQEDDE